MKENERAMNRAIHTAAMNFAFACRSFLEALVVAEVWAMVRSITMTMLRKHLAEAKHVYKIHERFSMISYNLYISV